METVLEDPLRQPGMLEVSMDSEICPKCGEMIPKGTLAEHLDECPGMPVRTVEKVVVREIIREIPRYVPLPDTMPRMRDPWSTGRVHTTRGVDVRVRRDQRYSSCSNTSSRGRRMG